MTNFFRYVSAYEHYRREPTIDPGSEKPRDLVRSVEISLTACPPGAPVPWVCSDHKLKLGVFAVGLEGWTSAFPNATFVVTTFHHYLHDPGSVLAAAAEATGLEHQAPTKAGSGNVHRHSSKHRSPADIAAMAALAAYYKPHNRRLWQLLHSLVRERSGFMRFVGSLGQF